MDKMDLSFLFLAGSSFNERGDLHPWWTPESKANFIEKTQCMVEQYNSYTVDQVDMNVSGTTYMKPVPEHFNSLLTFQLF